MSFVKNKFRTSFSELVHDPTTNRSIKTISFGNMRDSNYNKLATNIYTTDNSLIIIMLNLQINFLNFFDLS